MFICFINNFESYIFNICGITTVYKRNINKDYLPIEIKENIEKNFIIPKRQALHAKSIGFIHPYKKKEMFFESEEPKEFKGLISLMNKK